MAGKRCREALSPKEREKKRERGEITDEHVHATTYGKEKKSVVVPSRTVHANVAGRYLVFTSHFGILHRAPLRGPHV